MIKYANFDSYNIKFEGGDTFCVKTKITENDPILKYRPYKLRYRRWSITTLKLILSNF